MRTLVILVFSIFNYRSTIQLGIVIATWYAVYLLEIGEHEVKCLRVQVVIEGAIDAPKLPLTLSDPLLLRFRSFLIQPEQLFNQLITLSPKRPESKVTEATRFAPELLAEVLLC